MRKRFHHIIQGQVQGVGFRPFVFRLAHAHNLLGFVNNTPLGVIIEIEGSQNQISAFNEQFQKNLPPLAKISSHIITEIKLNKTKKISNIQEKKDSNKNEYNSFVIKQTNAEAHTGHTVLISPDVATCQDCQKDIFTKDTYRHAYPFTNCTNCGPRYTITHSIPYDRTSTSMACFPLCPTCKEEYENPFDRRFHAQPNACAICGPHLWLTSAKQTDCDYSIQKEHPHNIFYETELLQKSSPLELSTSSVELSPSSVELSPSSVELPLSPISPTNFSTSSNSKGNSKTPKLLNTQALRNCISLLGQGKIIAIKALGGFQLACDAYNESSIATLRIRKNRPHKAFALMLANIEEAKKIAYITKEAEELLCSPAAPIVLCPKKESTLPQNIAPDTHRIGIMLAYTPLHALLFNPEIMSENGNIFTPKALIMTSANASGEPICIKNRDAWASLQDIADAYLFHNRDILVRVDDSVCLALTDKNRQKQKTQQTDLPPTLFFRRARGYVPSPIAFPKKAFSLSITPEEASQYLAPSVFAAGSFLKNTFCLTRNTDAFLSQHIGDLDNLASTEFYEESFLHLQTLLEVTPQLVVCDLHPDFPSTHFAKKIAKQYNIPLMQLAHHFAHAYAVLAEYAHYDLSPSLALILDGTGQGTDGSIWGGELLYIAPKEGLMLRLGRLSPLILPGGDAAIKEPWRIAQAMYELCLEKKYLDSSAFDKYPFPWLQEEHCKKMSPMLTSMIEKNIQCIESSGCGRLFDAISALLGLCYSTTYEGQAAIKLEHEAHKHTNMLTDTQKKYYSCPIHEDTDIKQNKKQRIDNCRKEYAKETDNNENIKNTHTHNFENRAKNLLQETSNACINHAVNDESQKEHGLDDAKPIWNIDTYSLFTHFVQELGDKKNSAELADDFHHILSNAFCDMANKGMQLTGIHNIIVSGGVMNNEKLLCSMHETLTAQGFHVLTPRNVPSGDGSISLGQAFYGFIESQKQKKK